MHTPGTLARQQMKQSSSSSVSGGNSNSKAEHGAAKALATQQKLLQAVLDEIALCTAAIGQIPPTLSPVDTGYRRAVDLTNWRDAQRARLSETSGATPSPACVFLVRSVLESLCAGAMTEREIKVSWGEGLGVRVVM